MRVPTRPQRLALVPIALYVSSFLLPKHSLKSQGYVPGYRALRVWFEKLCPITVLEVPNSLLYLSALSSLANLLLIAGVTCLYRGKRPAAVFFGLAAVLLSSSAPLAFGPEMVTAPCFLAWQGSMVTLVAAAVLAILRPGVEVHQPEESQLNRAPQIETHHRRGPVQCASGDCVLASGDAILRSVRSNTVLSFATPLPRTSTVRRAITSPVRTRRCWSC